MVVKRITDKWTMKRGACDREEGRGGDDDRGQNFASYERWERTVGPERVGRKTQADERINMASESTKRGAKQPRGPSPDLQP